MEGQFEFLVEKNEYVADEAPDFIKDAWKKAKQDKRRDFTKKQQLPYERKLERQTDIAREFQNEMKSRGYNCHVSVGGLDSITLTVWLQSIGIDVPAISVSGVEDKSIQKVHRALGVEIVKSYKSKVEVLNDIGFPVISKKIAGKIDILQHPTDKLSLIHI